MKRKRPKGWRSFIEVDPNNLKADLQNELARCKMALHTETDPYFQFCLKASIASLAIQLQHME